ncbi:hypothetical protein [Kitasatospora sp. NPDC004272]
MTAALAADEQKLAHVTFAPITFTIGAVPVVRVPAFDLSVRLSVTGTVEITATGTLEQHIGVEASYQGERWSIRSLTTAPSGTFDATTTCADWPSSPESSPTPPG